MPSIISNRAAGDELASFQFWFYSVFVVTCVLILSIVVGLACCACCGTESRRKKDESKPPVDDSKGSGEQAVQPTIPSAVEHGKRKETKPEEVKESDPKTMIDAAKTAKLESSHIKTEKNREETSKKKTARDAFTGMAAGPPPPVVVLPPSKDEFGEVPAFTIVGPGHNASVMDTVMDMQGRHDFKPTLLVPVDEGATHTKPPAHTAATHRTVHGTNISTDQTKSEPAFLIPSRDVIRRQQLRMWGGKGIPEIAKAPVIEAPPKKETVKIPDPHRAPTLKDVPVKTHRAAPAIQTKAPILPAVARSPTRESKTLKSEIYTKKPPTPTKKPVPTSDSVSKRDKDQGAEKEILPSHNPPHNPPHKSQKPMPTKSVAANAKKAPPLKKTHESKNASDLMTETSHSAQMSASLSDAGS